MRRTCASCASDVCSNAIRVVKTKVQTSPEETVNPFLVTQEILAESRELNRRAALAEVVEAWRMP